MGVKGWYLVIQMNTERIFLAALDEMSEFNCKGFSLNIDDETLEGFLVRQNGKVFGYRNSCPHVGAPLDWMPDRFLDADGKYIQCSMHGALFEPESGLCVQGPCVSRHLEKLQVEMDNDKVYLRRPERR